MAAESSIWADLPRNTAMVIAINTLEETWTELDRFRTFQLLSETFGLVPNPGGLPYLPYNIDYLTHIQPWIGDQAIVAILPSTGGMVGEMADHTVMLAPIRNQEAFAAYVQVLTESQPAAPTTETFRQTDILFWPGQYEEFEDNPDQTFDGGKTTFKTWSLTPTLNLPLQATASKALPQGNPTFDLDIPLPVPQPSATGVAIAILPDTLVAAETVDAIKTYLRYRQSGQGSLARNPQFQRTLAHPQQARALVTVYGNALELLNFPTPDLPPFPGDWPLNGGIPPASLETLQALNFGGTLEALVFPSNQGLEFQGRFYYDNTPFTFGLTPRSPRADSVLEQLPASTYGLMSGRDLAGLWRQVSTVIDLMDDDFGFGLDDIRDGFTALTGLDLDHDVFGWMDGEIALAAFPATETPFQALSPRLQLGLGLLLQTSDRTTATNTLSTADELFTTLGFGVMSATVNNQPVTNWDLWSGWDSLPDAPRQSFLSHGWVTEDTVAIVSGPGTMKRVMNPSPHDPLRSFPLFQNAIGQFPDPNNGYFYVNVGSTLTLVYQTFNLHETPEFAPFKPFLGSVRTLSATTTQTSDYLELDAHLGLAPRAEN
jgi:hypothetical protein